MQTIDANDSIVIQKTTTSSLLAKVLWITTAGFVFTAIGAWVSPATPGIGVLFLFLIILGLTFAISRMREHPGLALTLFYVLTFLMGVYIGPLISMYLHMPNGQTIVFQAAMTTALGMAVMGIIAQFANFNYMKVGRIAMFGVFGLILIGLLSMFVYVVNPTIYAWLTLIIFSALLLVDFMRLRDGGLGASPVQLSLAIYLDALNIFLALLRIFGGGRRSSR